MPDRVRPPRLPGNRVVRRRQHATKIIAVSNEQIRRDVPSVRASAQKFVLGFILLVILGSVLLTLPLTSESGESTAWTDALFTSMSAASVTGLVTLDTQEHWNFIGELIILILLQIGGLGFMVGASLVLASLRRGSSLKDTMMLQDGSPALTLNEAGDLSRRILRFTLVTELIGAVLLSIRFMADEEPHVAIWYGVFHSVSAFCNAGFDLMGGFRSLSEYRSSIWVNVVVMALVQAGSLSFMFFSDINKQRKWTRFSLDTKLIMIANLTLIALGAILFLVTEWNSGLAGLPEPAKPLAAMFQSVAARTAGFATVSFGDLHAATIFLWTGIMLIGGASGSTAGGIKLATAAIVVIAVGSTIRGQPEAQAFGRRISPNLVFRSMAIIALFLTMFFTLTFALAASEDVLSDHDASFIELAMESMSALATVGVSTGITPGLSDLSKIILTVAMLLGRLGPLTAVYALQSRSRPARYRHPEATIRLG